MGFPVRIILVLVTALLCTGAPAQEVPKAWYPADTLDEGLGPRPDDLDLSTPRAAMRAFIEHGRSERFEAAAHVINLSDIDSDKQKDKALKIARQLYQVIDRRVWVDWSGLPCPSQARSPASSIPL